ncbi:hypothetical protein EON66_08715, partial [archaeon]
MRGHHCARYAHAHTHTSSFFVALRGTTRHTHLSRLLCCARLLAGVELISADIGGPAVTSVRSGTSMAAPVVSGIAALYLQVNPSASLDTVAEALT